MTETRPDRTRKSCSVCGKSFALSEFTYGSREDRSYCRGCNQQDQLAYSRGGLEAARAFRDEMRRKWKRDDA
jgi:hypothetical protein